MAEIMIALGREDSRTLFDLDRDLYSEIYGVKILDDEIYKLDGGNVVQTAISRMVRSKGAKKVFVDTKFAIDTPQEMIDGVEKVVESYTKPPRNFAHRKYTMQPDFLSTVVDLPELALRAFAEKTTKLEIIPVCHITPSRFTAKDFENRNTTPEKNAIWKINLFNAADNAIGAVVCAASDAKIVRERRPDLFIFATGAYLDEPYTERHPTAESISVASEYADVLIIGAPILKATNPGMELERRIVEARL